jgi:small nuclear ribonucleoprotein (snRNP)-like protein
MNLVLEDAYEVFLKKGTRTSLGRIMLKGDCITLITVAPVEE